MALDINRIPADVLESLQERGHSIARIESMTAAEAFDEHLSWEGIIGFGRRFYRDALALSEAER